MVPAVRVILSDEGCRFPRLGYFRGSCVTVVAMVLAARVFPETDSGCGGFRGSCAPAATQKMSGAASERRQLAEKALSESYGRLRYTDTSLLIWTQQQQELERRALGSGPGPGPDSFLGRSQSMWYRQYGNQSILIRDKRNMVPGPARSQFCLLM
ncbi:putative uncharacterized protein BRD3OS [Narcine bancroftii]|uniref:putative uncharacterized protein BRD3OS n=1 Tax=Narcine bancroftii TaxID=1343680 RepID=UPI00383182D4